MLESLSPDKTNLQPVLTLGSTPGSPSLAGVRVEAGDLRTDLLAKRRDTDEIYVKPTEIFEFGGTYEVRNSSSTDIPRILHP